MQLDVLLFDMDGVLIDVSESYRTASRETVQFYFEQLLGLAPLDGELVSRDDVAALKLAGGFNNDWDLTAALVKYLLSLIDPQAPSVIANRTFAEFTRSVMNEGLGVRSASAKHSPQSLPQIIDYLRRAGAKVSTRVAEIARRKDIAEFARRVAAEGGGPAAVRKILGDQNDRLLFASGDLRATNLSMRVFEEFYLDEKLFREEYREARHFVHADGVIHREKLIPNLQSLISLNQHVSLGIATGRPRNQARFALASAGIADLFRAVVTLEDILAEEKKRTAGQPISFSKPHPFSLLQVARNIGGKHARCAYVGDTPDDIRAANAAKREMDFVSIGCLASAENKTETRRAFERVGVDRVIEHPDELAAMI